MERKIIQQCMYQRIDLPEAIQNAPDLTTGLEIYLEAFFQLTTSRQYGMAAGPIPWSVINEYCKSMSITGQQREDMFFYIREMDNYYLKYLERKNGS